MARYDVDVRIQPRQHVRRTVRARSGHAAYERVMREHVESGGTPGMELAIVIRKRCRHATPERAREYVLGYTCLNDLTARDIEQHDHQKTRAKAFDTFCPIGPCISTDLDPNAAEVETWVNGELRQVGNTKGFVFPVEDVVARVSAVMTLLAGDVIATGTPAGVGPLLPGDRVEVRIDGIGSLKNPVIKLQEA